MKIVYSSFEDFTKRNQSILNIVSDKDDLNLLKAIWSARDGEILKLEMRSQRHNKEVSKLNQRISELESSVEKSSEKIRQLEETLKRAELSSLNSEDKVKKQERHILVLENDLEVLSVESDQLEKILHSKDKEIDRLESLINNEREHFDLREKKNEKMIERSAKLEESFEADQRYIKELELRVDKIQKQNNELNKIKTEYQDQFRVHKKRVSESTKLSNAQEAKVKDLDDRLKKKETLLKRASEKLNEIQNEYNISISRSKKLDAQIERLEIFSRDFKQKSDLLSKENVEIKKDNVEIVNYCESLKKEVRSLELSNEDLFSNQKELESYIDKLRKKANRDEIKVKELEKALEEEQLRKKLTLNEKHLIEKELQDYKGLLSEFESKLKNPKRVSNSIGRSLDH
tara:strand:+ start:4499 stop:5704 length:1206 start_codon:yes stop_codon:yes gene_type:complete